MIKPRFHYFDAVSSTNDVASEMAKRGEPEGTVVFANRQTKGRGRRGHSWHDEPGENVLMSVILTPGIPPALFHHLSFITSLAVANVLRTMCGLPAEVKWPNDVLVRDKKITGILVEIAPVDSGYAAVIGVGININQTSFPAELEEKATSVTLENGTCSDVKLLANSAAESIFSLYERYSVSGFKEILEQWRKYMWGIGRLVEVSTEGNMVSGTISGIDSEGALIITDSSGIERRIRAVESIEQR